MGLFSKLKKTVVNTLDPAELIKRDKKKKAAPADPDPINPLTGRPRSQDATIQGGGYTPPDQGLGQMPPQYLPPPVSMQQQIPQGLGSNVFRSTLAPLQQQGYGLGQIDPRLLTSTVRLPGGSMNPQMPPQMAPQMQPMQMPQFGLGRMPRMFL